MRTAAFYFTGSDLDQVEALNSAIQIITQDYIGKVHWVFALPPFLYKKAPRLAYVTYMPTNQFVRSRFKDVFQVNFVFGNNPRENWTTIAVDYLVNRFRLGHRPSAISKSLSSMRRDREVSLSFATVFNPCDGYGSSAEALATHMAKIDRQMSWIHVDRNGDALKHATADALKLGRFSERMDHGSMKAHLLYYTPNGWKKNNITRLARGLKVPIGLMTMFETTKLPSSWPNIINAHFDYVVVPAEFNKKVFQENGVHRPIHVCPLGVDPKRWPVLERKTEGRPFRFLLFSNTRWDCPRKNAHLTLEAFRKAFSENDNVELIIKTSFGGNIPALRKNEQVINGRFTHSELLQLLGSVDCLVFASSGEGYGLPPREAMSTGLPVIVSNWSALSDICKEGISYWVEPSGLQAAYIPGWLEGENGGSSRFGRFAKIESSDLAERMLHVFNNQEEAQAVGAAAAKWVRENETYEIAAKKLLEITVPDRLIEIEKEESKTLVPKEKTMDIKVQKINKKGKKRYIYFQVTNNLDEDYEPKNDLHVRFRSIETEDGLENDPSLGKVKFDKDVLAKGDTWEGRLTVEVDGELKGKLGVVTEFVRWHNTTDVSIS